MTLRAQAFAVAGIIGLCLGLIRGQWALSLLSLSSLLWLFLEWLAFYWQVRFQIPSLALVRLVNGESSAERSLWSDRLIDIEVRWNKKLHWYGVTLDLFDVVPENLEVIDAIDQSYSKKPIASQGKRRVRRASSSWLVTSFKDFLETSPSIAPNEFRMVGKLSAKWKYRARVRSAGVVRLSGYRLTLQSNHGFFRHEQFVQSEQNFRALPTFVDAGEYSSLIKKSNVIPRHGIHRLHRSGMGSELLELREYMTGDPFKSIAWKVSAKRDQLMTRQYESEVPARLQLIVDGCSTSRVGGFGLRLLDQMNYVAASIGRMAINAGDPVGGMLCDERGTRRLPPMAGEKGFQILLRALADFSVNPAPPPCALSERMVNAAWGVLSQRFPDLLDFKVNQMPFLMFPILPSNRARLRSRFLIAGALAEIYRLSTREHVAMVQDDPALARRIQIFLNDFGIPWIAPLVATSETRDRDPVARMNQLAGCMMSVIGHARDNELIVIMSDLLNCVGILDFLMPAVKLAIAKHHRVSFVCPTPTFLRPARRVVPNFSNASAEDLLLFAEQSRLQIQAEQLQRELQRCGASVSLSGEKNAIGVLLSELDSLRSGRSRSQRALR